jgi:anti-sigma B factor antagonist
VRLIALRTDRRLFVSQTQAPAEATVIRPSGELTASSIDEYRAEWLSLITAGKTNLVIDLAGITSLDSSGLGLLLQCSASVRNAGGTLALVTSDTNYLRLFRITRIDERIAIRQTVEPKQGD